MTDDLFEAIRAKITERQTKLLGSYVRPQLHVLPGDVEPADINALLGWELLKPAEGTPHRESFTGSRVSGPFIGGFEATGKGRSWFEWYGWQE